MIPKEMNYNLTKLPNGLTVVTETEGMPGNIHMGMFK